MRVKIVLKWKANELSVFETFQIIIWYQQNQNMQLFLMNAYFVYTAHCDVRHHIYSATTSTSMRFKVTMSVTRMWDALYGLAVLQ